MRPDHDVDPAVGDALDDGARLGGAVEARQRADLDGEVRQPLAERLEVLDGEDGRRDEDGHLLAVLDRLERGADRDLGLAVPDVPADQPVHRPRPLHVALDRLGGRPLVGRVLVEERGLHLPLPLGVGAEREAGRALAPRVELEQLVGELLDRGLGLRLLALPVAGPQPVDRRRAAVLAGELLDPRELLDGNVEELVLGVAELERLDVSLAGQLEPLEPLVLADAVVHVDEVVAGLDPGQVLDADSGRVAPAAADAAAAVEDLVVGVDGEGRVGHAEPALERADREPRLTQDVFREELLQPLELPQVIAEDDGLDARREVVPEDLRQSPHRSQDRLGLARGEADRRVVAVHVERREIESTIGLERERERIRREPQSLGRRYDPLLARLGVAAENLLPCLSGGGREPRGLVAHDERVGMEPLGQRRQTCRIIRLIRRHLVRPLPFVARAEIARPLARRQDLDPPERRERALRPQIEGANRLHPVADQLDPHGVLVAIPEHVDDAAPDRERAHLRDHRLALEPHADESARKVVEVDAVAGRHPQEPVLERRRRQDLLERRARSRDADPDAPLEKAREELEPLPLDLLLGGALLVGQDLPLGIPAHGPFPEDRLEVRQPRLAALRGRRQDEERHAEVLREGGSEDGLARSGQVRGPHRSGFPGELAAHGAEGGGGAEALADLFDDHGRSLYGPVCKDGRGGRNASRPAVRGGPPPRRRARATARTSAHGHSSGPRRRGNSAERQASGATAAPHAASHVAGATRARSPSAGSPLTATKIALPAGSRTR